MKKNDPKFTDDIKVVITIIIVVIALIVVSGIMIKYYGINDIRTLIVCTYTALCITSSLYEMRRYFLNVFYQFQTYWDFNSSMIIERTFIVVLAILIMILLIIAGIVLNVPFLIPIAAIAVGVTTKVLWNRSRRRDE